MTRTARLALLACILCCGPNIVLAGPIYATDPASVNKGNYSAADIPGLVNGDVLAPFSFGYDPINPNLYFTVDRQAIGAAQSAVADLSDPAVDGGANGDIFYSAAGSATNALFKYGTSLGLKPGFLGDDITGLSLLPRIDNVFFALSPGSPTLATLGVSPADILMSGPGGLRDFARPTTFGLTSKDQLSGLVLNVQSDTALFTISSFSADATTAGGLLDPANVYMTTFNGSNSVFRTAADLGLLPGDQIQDISTVPEPSSVSLLLIGLGMLILFHVRRRFARALGLLVAVLALIPAQVFAAETCSTMAGNSPPVANSAGTLILPDLSTKNFRWVSNDPVFGAIDTSVVAANTFTVSNTNPPRVVFTASVNGMNYQGNVLLGTYQRGTVNVYTATKQISYLITPPQLEVANIEFDWKSPTENKTDASAAITMRKDKANPLAFTRPPVDPGNKGPTFGEWVKKLKNEPALYVADQTVTIKVRFTSSSKYLLAADISARAQSGLLPNVKMTAVRLSGGATNVSNPEYVQMTLDRATDASINKVSETWMWQFENGCGSAVSQLDTSGPHTIYTVLALPKTPWYDTAHQQPWASALDFVTDSTKVNLIGEDLIEGATTKVTDFLFSRYGLIYDSGDNPGAGGRANYMDFVGGKCKYNLPGFMTKSGCERSTVAMPTKSCDTVNCHDLAASASTFINLIGGASGLRYMQPNGYMNKEALVGRGQTNNPFYLTGAYQAAQVIMPGTPAPVGCLNTMVGGKIGRSRFSTHGFVTLNGLVIDAMGGPFTGTLNIADYLAASIDPSPLKAVGPPPVKCTDIGTIDATTMKGSGINGGSGDVRAGAIAIVLEKP